MEKLNISYATYKTLSNSYTLPTYYLNGGPAGYTLYMSGKNFIYICNIFMPDDITDFEGNYKDASTPTTENDDAIALATYPYKWAMSGYEIAQKSLYVDGKLLEITSGNNTGYVEWDYNSMVELQGVDGAVSNGGAVYGDYINMGIYHPIYGEINRFGNNVYLMGNQTYGVTSDKISQIPTGLKIRLTYQAVDTDGRQMVARLRIWK